MTIKRQQHCVNTNRGKLWLIIKNFTFNYITSIANFYSELFLPTDIKLFVLVISNQQLSNNFVP